MQEKLVAGFLLAIIILVGGQAMAQDAELVVKPNKCVALRKGEKCYQSLLLRYSASDKADICLFREDQLEPLACWNDSRRVEFRYRLVSSTSIWFHIADADQNSLARAKVNVAWVYKQSRKRNQWRLF